jgi:hypothetical protein
VNKVVLDEFIPDISRCPEVPMNEEKLEEKLLRYRSKKETSRISEST